MFTLYLTYNGDYDTYTKWTTKFDYNDTLREMGLVIICTMDEEPVNGEMDNYVAEWMVSGRKPEDTTELKNALDKSIREFLKSKNDLKDFSLVKIEMK